MYKLKNDKYRRQRGGRATLLKIHCSSCDSQVAFYQKDGPGQLHRLYLNRIFEPPQLERLQREPFHSDEDISNLVCKGCDTLLGVPITHCDGRFAYRIVPGTVYRRLVK